MSKPGWTYGLRQHGEAFLDWARRHSSLQERGAILAQCLRRILLDRVSSKEAAEAVWAAAPHVLRRCNEQSTYRLPFAPEAYAWLHFLDRYARTWRALKVLVSQCSLPMGKYRVNTLDIGTGPGPSAFAVHDFYQTMVAFAKAERVATFCQPCEVTCVELDDATNGLRSRIMASLMETESASAGMGAIGGFVRDFSTLDFAQDRRVKFDALRREEYEYFNEIRGHWDSDPAYTVQEANQAGQSLHRYRLFIFSNFLTTVGTVQMFKGNLMKLLGDAGIGAVVLVLGAQGHEYPAIYEYVDGLTSATGFSTVIADRRVSSSDTPLSDLVYDEGRHFYMHLQALAPNADKSMKAIHRHYGRSRGSAASSSARAYRKVGIGHKNFAS